MLSNLNSQIYSTSSDKKTFLVVNYSSTNEEVSFFEFKIIKNLPHEISGNWCIRKEYTEILKDRTGKFLNLIYVPIIKIHQLSRVKFSLNTFIKYLEKYEITVENKSKSKSRVPCKIK